MEKLPHGVYVVGGTINKTGGTITGVNAENGNMISRSGGGSAIYAESEEVTKHRETTAGLWDNLSFNGNDGSFTGEWE